MESESKTELERDASRRRKAWLVMLVFVALIISISVFALASRPSVKDKTVLETATPEPTVWQTPVASGAVIETPAPSPTATGQLEYVKTAIIIDGTQTLILASRQAAEELMRNVQAHFENLEAIPADAVTVLTNTLELVPASADAMTTSYDNAFAFFTGRATPLVYESTVAFTMEEVIPHENTVTENDELPIGYRIVRIYGMDGITHNSYTAKYRNGVRIELDPVESVVVRQVVNGEIIIGVGEYGEDYVPAPDFGEFVPTIGGMTFIAPVQGAVSRYFGVYGTLFHHGIDIECDYGTDIVASCGGTVVSVMERGEYGLMIEIDHGDGFSTRYALLSQASVAVGDPVRQGDLIGKTGYASDGLATILHFELRLRAYAYNPLHYLDIDE